MPVRAAATNRSSSACPKVGQPDDFEGRTLDRLLKCVREAEQPMARLISFALLVPVACTGIDIDQDAQQSVAQRRTSMIAMSGEMRGLGAQISDSTPDPVIVAQHATRLANLAARIVPLFPRESGPDTGLATLAKAEIWARPEEFESHAAGLTDAAQSLAASARAGDLSDLRTQAMTIDAICVGCHRDFREQ